MVFASLGIFSTIFNWVLEKILSPVFSFISKLLEAVLGWLFREILAPILQSVIWPLIQLAIDTVIKVLAGVLYSLLASLLRLVDQMETAFDIFIGLKNVTSKSYGEGSLLTVLYQMKAVKTAFWLILFIGLGIALMLTIYATAKSAFDLDFENKRPVSRVLKSFMKTFFYFFMIPFLVLVMIQLSGVILKGMDSALTAGKDETTLGRMVFVVSSLDAAKEESYNISSASPVGNIGIEDNVRGRFYNGTVSYTDKSEVEKSFEYEKFDYLVGFGMGIFLLIIMAACLVVFVQRVFDIIVLYLASPFFVAMMPLDDGEKFQRWREMFLGKCFTGFGSMAAMKIYLMLCPIIMGNQISFAQNSSVESTYLIKMIFMLGGAWAVLKAGPMITSLISSASGGTEQQTGEMAAAAFVGTARMGAGLAAQGIAWGAGKISGSMNHSSQKFEEMRKEAPGSSGIPGISQKEKEQEAFSGEDSSLGGGKAGGSSGKPGIGAASGNAADHKSPEAGRETTPGKPLEEATEPGAADITEPADPGEREEPGQAEIGEPAEPGEGEEPEPAETGEPAEPGEGEEPGQAEIGEPAEPGEGEEPGQAEIGEPADPGEGEEPEPAETGEPAEPGEEPEPAAITGPGAAEPEEPEAIAPAVAPREETPRIAPKKLFSTVLGLGIDRNRKGKKALAVRWGNFFTAGHDEKGNFHLKILGASMKWDSEGKFKQGGFRFMGTEVFKSKRGQDGKFHLAKLNILGAKFKTDKESGKLYFSRLSMIGLRREIGPDQKAHLTRLKVLGLERQKLANGEYRVTSCAWGLFRQIYGVSESGKTSVFATRALGMNLYKSYGDEEKNNNESDSQENKGDNGVL